MITSGRPEFGDLLWPLLTHEDDQIHLVALRAAKRFRPSVLGSDAPNRIAALPPEIRKHVLFEIAANSSVDGLDLATAIAKNDADPDVKGAIVDALAFRRADHHVIDLLSDAGDATYDILAETGHIDDIAIETVQEGLAAARGRQKAAGGFERQRLRAILYEKRNGNRDAEVADIVAEIQIGGPQDAGLYWLYEMQRHFPKGLAEGLLRRVRENRPLFHGADDMLAAVGFAIEDDTMLDIAKEDSNGYDPRADAAASVLGPQAVGKLVDAYLAACKFIRDAGKYDKAASDRRYGLRARIEHAPGPSLIAAIQARAATGDNEEITQLAELLSRESHGVEDRARRFSQEGLDTIGALAQDWGDRLLASGNASRWQTASIATLISHAPSAQLLPLLKRSLDDNLRRYRAFREEAKANGWRPCKAVNEARMPCTLEYQRAFAAIKSPEITALMGEYLSDEHFGELAARVLAIQWSEANEPRNDTKFFGGVDFTHVAPRRAARATNPSESSNEAA